MWIGSKKMCKRNRSDFKWKIFPNNSVKSLGVHFSSTKPIDNIPLNWEMKVEKIKNIIQAWKRRYLSMVGKIIIVKSMLASQMTYAASVLNLPEHVIKDVNKTLFQFVWGSNEKVKRRTLINEYSKGGLNMLHLPSFLESLKFSWVKRLTNTSVATWKNIPLFELNKSNFGLRIFECNCDYTSLSNEYVHQLNRMSPFYRNIIKLWFKCKKNLDVDQIDNPGQETIWNNTGIKYRCKTLYYKDWIKKGILTISDLYNNEGNIMSISELNDIINKPGGVMLEYLALLSAIPRDWKYLKTLDNNSKCKNGLKYATKYYQLDGCTSKLIRLILISKLSVKPNCEAFWERKFYSYDFDWLNIWKNIPSNMKEARLITLNWKILSNIYPTNILLAKIGKSNTSKCKICNVEDYLEHFFFYCKNVRCLWDEINSTILRKTDKKVYLTVTDCLFGYYKGTKEEMQIINTLIIVGKLCVSKFKYGNYPNLLVLLKQEIRYRGI